VSQFTGSESLNEIKVRYEILSEFWANFSGFQTLLEVSVAEPDYEPIHVEFEGILQKFKADMEGELATKLESTSQADRRTGQRHMRSPLNGMGKSAENYQKYICLHLTEDSYLCPCGFSIRSSNCLYAYERSKINKSILIGKLYVLTRGFFSVLQYPDSRSHSACASV
jgi:hypothetical protein